MDAEEFRDVPGWPGYRVGSNGSVLSCRDNGGNMTDTWNQRVLAVDRDGYHKLALHNHRKTWFTGAHVLVALAFIGDKPFRGSIVLHQNGNRCDNRVCNLRWGTHKENSIDRDSHGTTARGALNGRAKLSTEDVIAVRVAHRHGESCRAIAKRLGMAKSTIVRICNGRAWRSVREELTEKDAAQEAALIATTKPGVLP